MNTNEMRERRNALVAEAQVILDRSATVLADGDRQRFDAITAEIETLDGDLERRETLARSLKSDATVTRASGDGAPLYGAPQFMRRTDAGETLTRAIAEGADETDRGRALLRDAAARSVDGWSALGVTAERQEAATALMTREGSTSPNGARIAQHVTALSDESYVDAFYAFVRGGPSVLNGEQIRALQRGQSLARALNEGSGSAGQYTVPPFLDPTIILTNTGIMGSIRGASTVKTITTQTWKGVSSQGVTAEWTAEAAEMTDASPSFSQPTITPVRLDAYVQASFEVLEDTNIATELASLFADAYDRLTETAFVTGTGSTQPYGIVTELDLVTASRVTSQSNGVLSYQDIFSTDSALPARYRKNASWVLAPKTINAIRQFNVTGASPFASTFIADFAGDVPSKLLGRTIIDHSAMPSTQTSSTDIVVYGDFRAGYFVIERLGVQVAYNPIVLGSNRRPSGEVGWAMFARVGARAVNADAFRMLRLA